MEDFADSFVLPVDDDILDMYAEEQQAMDAENGEAQAEEEHSLRLSTESDNYGITPMKMLAGGGNTGKSDIV